MIRTTLLWMLVTYLAIYSWRDWYKALCGLILLMAVVEHPDFPKSVMGVQGLNPWNLLLLVITLAWMATRGREGLRWDMPKKFRNLLIVYLLIIAISFLRLIHDMDSMVELARLFGVPAPSVLELVSEHIINAMKWVVPGLLLYDGCRSEERFRLATYCVLAVYVLLAIQVIRWMPLSALTSGSVLEDRSLKILSNEVGYHRVNMAMLLGGGSWAIFCARGLPESRFMLKMTVFFAGIVFFGMALTGGRMGFATWVAIAMFFGFFKWRKVIFLAPIAMALIIAFVPAVQERMMQGFTEQSIDTNVNIESLQYADEDGPHMYTVTAGRTFAWQFVLEKIADAPLLGYGMEAMKRTGVATYLWLEYGESFPHPHNAYLQWIFDNGIIGFIPVLLFYFFIVRMSLGLFLDRGDKTAVAIGGVTLSLVLALLIASMGSQTFYPREGAVGMWCAIGLALRVYVQKQYALREAAKQTRKTPKQPAGTRIAEPAPAMNYWKLKDTRMPFHRYRYG